MSIVDFSLDRYRFESIEAHSLDSTLEEDQIVQMRFEVGFSDELDENNEFAISLKVELVAQQNGGHKNLLATTARGMFIFADPEAAHLIKEPLERLYATSLLYGALRPALDAIIANIGMRGLSMPLNLPVSEEGRLPEAAGNDT